MRVLLLGGTGVIGTYLSNKLNENGSHIYITTRNPNRLNIDNIHFICGNAMDSSFIQTVVELQKWDVIVDFMLYNTKQFADRVDLLLSHTKQYVFLSYARVYVNLEHPIKESSPRLLDYINDEEYLSTDEYALTKARQENILFSSKYSNYTIIRPCITYGPERLQLGVLEKEEWLYRALKGRTVVLCREIMDSITTMTIGADVCRALLSTIGNDTCLGQTYHLTSSHHRSWNQILSIYKNVFRQITGCDFKYKYVELDKFLHCRLDIQRYQVLYDRIYNRDYDTSKESLLFDVNNCVSPEEGLTECLSSFIKDNKSFRFVNPVFEARKDKLTKEYTPLNEFRGVKNKIKYIVERFIKS